MEAPRLPEDVAVAVEQMQLSAGPRRGPGSTVTRRRRSWERPGLWLGWPCPLGGALAPRPAAVALRNCPEESQK